jgi:hypothetical protein
MLARHVALVSQTSHVRLDQLAVAAAAIQKQITRDFGPIWEVDADVVAFRRLSDVPLGYWPIIIRDDIHEQGARGIHLNKQNGQPFALVQFSQNWTLTTSHECLEMLADPSGNRTQAGNSVKPEQGRVEYLVEVCDPSEAAEFGYSVNGVPVSDFYTPNFFDPVGAPGVLYSFTGAITEPRKVLDGGYLSWLDPESRHLWQLFVEGGQPDFKDRGEVPGDMENLRSFSDRHSATYRTKAMTKRPMRENLILTNKAAPFYGAPAADLDRAHAAHAAMLQKLIGKPFPASKEDIRQAQRQLRELDIYNGPEHGDLDSDFKKALRKFRDRFGLVAWLAAASDDNDRPNNPVSGALAAGGGDNDIGNNNVA